MKRRIFSVLLAVVLVVSFSLVTAAPVSATDGSGTCNVSPTEVVVGSTNNTLTFTFTANETMDGGAITIEAPSLWSVPQGDNVTAAGYTTASSSGTLGKVLTTLDATDGWSASTANITLSANTTDGYYKEGGVSLKAAIAEPAVAGDKWYYVTSGNWSSYTKVGFWICSSVSTSSGNLTFAIAEDANLTAPTDNISIPPLTVNEWKHVTFDLALDSTTRDAVLSYGIVMTDDIGAADVFLDEILIGPDSANAISFAGQVTTARILALANTETITVVYGHGGGTSGATAQTTAGTATFTTKSKSAADGTLANLIAGSPEVTVNPGPATQLAFTTQPAGSVSGIALTTQPVVEARDQYGNKDTSYVANVVAATDDSGTLTGTTTKAAEAGVATFTDLIYTATADGETFQIDVTSEGLTGATSNDVVSNVVTLYYTPKSGEGGEDAPPQPPIETNLFGVEVSFRISSAGMILEPIEATSADGKLIITIPAGTIALDKDGNPLSTMTADIDPSPPSPPSYIIGLAYDFGPEGATFDPPITFTWSYDPDEVPEGVAEEYLVLAYYDEDAGEWVECECTCDPETHCVTACVCHFTTFAIIGAPKPAAFTLSSLAISPAEVAPGEKVNIGCSLANTGGLEGSYTVVLKINGLKEAEQSATIAAGTSKTVTFIVAKEEAGSYSVTVDGMSGSFVVVAPLVIAPPPPAPPPAPLAPPPAPAGTTTASTTATQLWPLIGGGIIVATIVAGLLIFFLIRRRAA